MYVTEVKKGRLKQLAFVWSQLSAVGVDWMSMSLIM